MNLHDIQQENLALGVDDVPVAAMRGQLTTAPLLALHIQAGRSILTVRSRKTGTRFTFRFGRPRAKVSLGGRDREGADRPVWVSVLTGPDNEAHYEYLGTAWLDRAGEAWTYRHALKKSRIGVDAPSAKAAAWVFKWLTLDSKVLLKEAEWWHEGRCGRCGRRLTVPESIATGIGPECAAYLGLR